MARAGTLLFKYISNGIKLITNHVHPLKHTGGHLPKITQFDLAGVPTSEIMQLGGWKKEGTLKAYLLAGGIELAKESAGRAFFR